MKKLVYIFLLFLFPCIHAQEEFFGNEPGLSFLYMRGIHHEIRPIYGIGGSMYFKNGLSLGGGLEQTGTLNYPFASIVYYVKSGYERIYPNAALGLNYTEIGPTRFFGLSAGYIRYFSLVENYPFSITGTLEIQIAYTQLDESTIEGTPVVGLGYTQALFTNSKVYPVLEIAPSFDMKNNEFLLLAIIGLNIRLWSMPE
ncbi:MAG: hypothetical protein JXJ22_12555 [Bacteroidales bacterium]|nr:hypothetical protein [Bacteroidales bacterium]